MENQYPRPPNRRMLALNSKRRNLRLEPRRTGLVVEPIPQLNINLARVDEVGPPKRKAVIEQPPFICGVRRMHGSMGYNLLSMREREVMLLAAKGFANKMIARELSLTEGTVKLHLHRVYKKLGVRGRSALDPTVVKVPKEQGR